MAVRDWLARTFGAKASVIGLEAHELPGRPLESGFDNDRLISTYQDDAWPYILANKGGEQASQAPLVVGRMVKDEFVKAEPTHPVQQLLDAPNPMMDGGEWIHTLWLYMELAGHSPIEVVKPTGGGVIGAPGRRGARQRTGFELWLHSPGPWRIVANPDATIKGYIWMKTSVDTLRWTPDQMTYLRWPNPANKWYGQGRIAALRNEVMAEEYAAIRDKQFEKNLGVPPGILSSEMPLGDPQAKELQKRWEQAAGGYRNAGKIAILGSKTTYQQITPNAHEADWLLTRRFRIETMAAAFGIPMPLILMQDAKFANAQEARAEFWEGTLQPRLNRIARMLTQRVLPLVTSEPLEVRFDYDKIEALGENDLEAAQTAGQWAQTGAVTVDEIRHRLGLEPMGDETGKRLLIPSTLQLQTPQEITENAKLGAESQRATIETTRKPPAVPVKPTGTNPKKDREPDEDVIDPIILSAYKRDLASFFRAQHAALTPAIPKALPEEEGRSIIERALAILAENRWANRIRRISEAPISSSLTAGATEAATQLGISVSFAIPASEDALTYLTQHLNQLAVGIQNTTTEAVRDVLEGALRDGLTNAQTRKALADLFDGYQEWRLDRISRTETRAAYNLGAIKQYRDAGVTFVRVIDGDLDDNCASWNGRTVTLDEAEGAPLGHPNCRRTWVPDTGALGREPVRDARPAVPKATEADMPDIHIHLPESLAMAATPTPIVNVAPPDVRVDLTAVADAIRSIPVPVIHAPDLTPVAKAVSELRGAMARDNAEILAAIRKPRKRRLITDDFGRPIGTDEE